jgi:ribonuclease-3
LAQAERSGEGGGQPRRRSPRAQAQPIKSGSRRVAAGVGGPDEPASRRTPTLARAVGLKFRDPDIAKLSLTHRSFAFEQGLHATNERLEFLGDAILGMVVTDLAYREFPHLSEGELAKLRAATVNMTTLAEVARELGLGQLVLLGKGEEMSGGRDKTSILADAMEAVLGAVYIDRGLKVARGLIERLFWPRMAAYSRGEGDRDYKTILQELSSQELSAVPEYRIASQGPDHAKEFTATVFVAGRRLGRGVGRSKKEAEQHAAHQAHRKLTAAKASSAKPRTAKS